MSTDRDGKFIALGQRARIANTRNTELDGRVVAIRAYRELGPGIVWPCFEEGGELWPLNPEWLVATSRQPTNDIEQLPLFGGGRAGDND